MNKSMNYQKVLTVAWIGCCGLLHSMQKSDAALPREVNQFLQNHCADCHGGGADEGDFELTSLREDLTDPTAHDVWQLVHHRIESGEMPPQDYEQPSDEDRAAAVQAMLQSLGEAQSQRQAIEGRVTARRLNQTEFETTLSDLLGMPLDVADRLPADAKREGFTTVGDALNISSVQMQAYLEAIDTAIDQSVALTEQPRTDKFRLSLLNNRGYMQVYRRQHPALPVVDGMNLYAREEMSFHHGLWGQYVVPRDGRYRIKVSAYRVHTDQPIALTMRVGGSGHKESLDVKHKLLEHFEIESDQPSVHHWEGHLTRGHFLHLHPSELPIHRFPVKGLYRQLQWRGPGVCVQWLEIEGPIVDQWPPAGQEALFGGVATQPIEGAKAEDLNEQLRQPPTVVAKPKRLPNDWPPKDPPPVDQLPGGSPLPTYGGELIYRDAKQPGPLQRTLQFDPADPKADADRLIRRMLPLAFRRPVGTDEANDYVKFVHDWIDQGVSFESAMRTGYKAIFTSPSFLFHRSTITPRESDQPVKRLDDYALAERLSYFLWCSTPDAQLRRLADGGRLSHPDVLRQQVERLLNDPRSDRFVEDFLGQWLDLHEIEFTSPDLHLFPEYDEVLHDSMLMESHAFFRHLLDENLPANYLVKSDFVTVNRRLAQHYEIEGAKGMKPVVVKLPADCVRGGVMTQAAVLKVTANGTNTSPVVRGKWVLERIMGQPPSPPPPGIPAVEPDIRGAVTIRQQLEKHRADTACASCHAKIDPPGVALESFDPIGRYRRNYRVLDPDKADLRKQDRTLRYDEGLPVDASYQLADGRRFGDIREFTSLIAEDQSAMARTLTDRLLVYSTGATTSLADRSAINEIVQSTADQEHGVRSLIHAIVQSKLFTMP